MVNEEDIHPEQLPEGVLDFIEDARATVAEQTGTDEDKVVFLGMTLHFTADGLKTPFEVMKV